MQLFLQGIKYATNAHFNLISVYMFDDGDFDNHFNFGKWKLRKGNLVMARWNKGSKFY